MDCGIVATTARSAAFRERLASLLLDLCSVDTGPTSDLDATRRHEEAVFHRIDDEISSLGIDGSRIVRAPIRPDIADHPFYSLPHYTAAGAGRDVLSTEQTYRGRYDLLYEVDGGSSHGCGSGLAVNAHIDVVRPFSAPERDGSIIRGRGSCDDKGPLASIVGALMLVARYLDAASVRLGSDLTAMFVIDEEMGGNGSLSLATDRDLDARYDTVLVLECTSSVIHPANRGAVWYKVEGRLPGADLIEAAAFIYDEMEREGRAIKSESRHPMFPHRPVQTCHGILGGYGEHPSRINGRVDLDILVDPASPERIAGGADLLTDVIESGLSEYVGVYGDKTKVIDPQTGTAKVERHYDVLPAAHGYTVRVYGATGHMGSILVNDGAITKMAVMARAVIASRSALETSLGGRVRLGLHGWQDPARLVMEGGQGFVPTHALPEIQSRLSAAVMRGADRYLRLTGRHGSAADFLAVTFDKLHNAAYAGPPDSPAMANAIEAAQKAGIWTGEPIRGWDVSCDARIFAHERPDAMVLTAGPGHLAHAHSDHEQVDLDDVVRFAEFLAYFILRQTNTCTEETSPSGA